MKRIDFNFILFSTTRNSGIKKKIGDGNIRSYLHRLKIIGSSQCPHNTAHKQ